MYQNALFLFRRDLRIMDNTALIQASQNSHVLHTAFIFDPRQMHHDYFSPNAFAFLHQSLTELQDKMKSFGGHLNIFSGLPEEVLESILQKKQIDALYINTDYTPFAKERDQHLKDLCQKHQVAFHSFHDVLLTYPGSVLKDDKTPYTIFTPFYTKAKKTPIRTVNPHIPENLAPDPLEKNHPLQDIEAVSHAPQLRLQGRRTEALTLLKNLPHNYEMRRNIPSENGLSGYPIVDAGMRELKTTGYMHNRVRMITASFLVKHLHIDWRWAASTGCDAQPYFRIFNPKRQQKQFDTEAQYRKA